MRRTTIGVPGMVLAISFLTAATAQAATTCDVKSMQTAVPKDTTIVSAELLDAPVKHCKVDGYVTTTNPGPNKVNFRVQLPDKKDWNNRYYFIGMGATAGFVPTTSQIPAGNPIVKGFAVAGTDTGHQNRADWSFFGTNPAQGEDHLHRGAHVTAVATQQITKKYYGTDKLYRYHSGCSGGGRMGMEALTKHPEDYDGILLGAPGMGPGFASETMIAFIHLGQQINREPGAWVSPDKLKMLETKVTEHCDPLDGVKDGVVWEHEVCKYDFKKLQCKSGDNPDCLTAPEIRTIEAIAAGPPGPNGPIKAGYPITNMSTWSTFVGGPTPWPDPLTAQNMIKASPGYFMGNSLARAYFGDDYNGLKQFKFKDQKQLDDWNAGAQRVGFGKPYSTDISGFQKNGGKIIFWNGTSDVCCHDQDLIKYFNTAGEKLGGMDKLASFGRFYKVPAMGHCGGGTGPQDAPDKMLEALVAWVEKGEAPGPIVTHRGDTAKLLFADPKSGTVSGVVVPPSTGSTRDFLLCPHPTIAKFNGKTGGEADAANWSCK